MATATHDDVCRLFPGIQDHTIVDVLATQPSIAELEAALQMLQEDDESLIETKQREGGRLNCLIAILANAEILFDDDVDR